MRRLWLVPLALATAGCGGDGVLEEAMGPPAGGAPTLTSLQASIFTPKCAIDGCHAGSAPEQGMNLSAGKTYVYTVGVASVELPGYLRVAPNDPDASYLYMKVSGDPRILGERMPFGGTISQAEIDAIRAWIAAGARND